MRVPWLQVESDFISAHAADLGAYLGISRREAIGLAVDLWTWALGRAADDAPPDGLVTGTGPVPDRLLAGSVAWTGPVAQLVDGLLAVGLVVRIDGGYRIAGIERYKATWEKNQRRPGEKPDENRSGTGPVPTRKTQTHRKTTTTTSATRAAEPQEDLPIDPLAPELTIEPGPEPPPASENPPPAHDVGPGHANGVRRGGSPSARQARQKGSQGPSDAPPGHLRRQLSDALVAVYFGVCGCKYPFGSRDAAKLDDILRLADGDVVEAAARFRWALSDLPPWQGGPPKEGATKFIHRLPAVWAALAGVPRVRAGGTGPPWLATPAGAAWRAGLERVREVGAPTYALEHAQACALGSRLEGEQVVLQVDRFAADWLEEHLPVESREAFGALRWEVAGGQPSG